MTTEETEEALRHHGVDEETLQVLLRPGQDPRAADVFLDFTSYRYALPLSVFLLPNGNLVFQLCVWAENTGHVVRLRF
jgi:hypothetical protein